MYVWKSENRNRFRAGNIELKGILTPNVEWAHATHLKLNP